MAVGQSPQADVSWPSRSIKLFSKSAFMPLEIDQPCEVSSSHAVMQPLSPTQMLSLSRSLCLPRSSDIGLSDDQARACRRSGQTESAALLACIRSRPIRRSTLRQHCGLIVHEGLTAWKMHTTARTYAAARSRIIVL